jgi:hypothetical protein
MKKFLALASFPALLLLGCSGASNSDSASQSDSTYVSGDDSSSSDTQDSSDSSESSYGYRYPEAERASFIDSCNSTSNGQYDYCVCALEALEKTYSWDELTYLMSQDGGLEEIQQFGIRECSWAIN